MKTDPFMCRPVIFMELLHRFGVEFVGKGEAEQGVDPGAVFNGQFLYFHAGNSSRWFLDIMCSFSALSGSRKSVRANSPHGVWKKL
jgi:hypothetical protein